MSWLSTWAESSTLRVASALMSSLTVAATIRSPLCAAQRLAAFVAHWRRLFQFRPSVRRWAWFDARERLSHPAEMPAGAPPAARPWHAREIKAFHAI